MPPRPRSLRPLWVALAATFCVRALVTLSRLDELELELYNGSLAKALLAGMPLDTAQLPVVVHLRGSFFMGLFLTPFFLVFGATLWAVKAAALAWSLATVAVLVRVTQRVLGDGAAVVAGLAFAFLPPSYQMVDVLALGSHGETVLLAWLGLWYVMSRRAESFGSPREVLGFGLLLGLGFLFSMQFVAAIPALVVAWFVNERRLTGASRTLVELPRVFLPTLAGTVLVLGFLAPRIQDRVPPMLMISGVGLLLAGAAWRWRRHVGLAFLSGLVLGVVPVPFLTRSTKLVNKELSERLLPEGVLGSLAKLWRVVSDELAASWLFAENGVVFGAWLFGGALLVAFVLTARRALRGCPLAVALVLHPLLFFGVYAATDLQVNLDMTLDGMGSRYLMPVLGCACGWLAVAWRELSDSSSPRAVLAVTAAPLAAGLLGVAALVDPGVGLSQPRTLGTQFSVFHGHFQAAAGEDLGERLAWIERVDPDWAATRPARYYSVLNVRPNLGSFLEQLAAVSARDTELCDYLMFQLGRAACNSGRLVDPVAARTCLEAVRPDRRVWFLRGVGGADGLAAVEALARRRRMDALEGHALALTPVLATVLGLPPEPRAHALQGAGYELGLVTTPYQRMVHDVFAALRLQAGEAERSAFYQGLGLGYRTRFVEATYRPPAEGELRIEAFLEPLEVEAFRAGLAAPLLGWPEPTDFPDGWDLAGGD